MLSISPVFQQLPKENRNMKIMVLQLSRFQAIVAAIIISKSVASNMILETPRKVRHRSIVVTMKYHENPDGRNLQSDSAQTFIPSSSPSPLPSLQLSKLVSTLPTVIPSKEPSPKRMDKPSTLPSHTPSMLSTIIPSFKRSAFPSTKPTSKRSTKPSTLPSFRATERPSAKPTIIGSVRPSITPSIKKSHHPSIRPSVKITAHPSLRPSIKATARPSVRPSIKATARPSVRPSIKVTNRPSLRPTIKATARPSVRPSIKATAHPSLRLSIKATTNPSRKPTARLSAKPSLKISPQQKKNSYLGLIVGLCVGLGSASVLSLIFYFMTKQKRGRQHQRLMDINSPKNDKPINHLDPISTSAIQQPEEESNPLSPPSAPIPLSPESLDLGSSSSDQDLMLTESDPFSASGGNPYPIEQEYARRLAIDASASTEESLGMGLNISPNALHDANRPRPYFSFPSGAQSMPGTQYSPSDRNASVPFHSGLIHVNHDDYHIFDCTVPPGPLGLVVDSTPLGPIIHSIKASSHLLSILSPGDLIVGLDGINTRGLSAPSLTRLMAKKIQQPERVLTIMRHK